ncbi:MAG TPA: DUF4307 domain-containing protein [Dermatophilaceae bacterium]|nr:DUF4307 domain-containing protein [Dermatophilaceae bacterium]
MPTAAPPAGPGPAVSRRTWWLLGTVGVAGGVAIAIWFGLAATVGRVGWTDLGYRVLDNQTVQVSYQVHRPDAERVTCTLRALDRSFGTVGTVEVVVPAGGPGTVQRTDRIRTTTRAVTGLVRECRR